MDKRNRGLLRPSLELVMYHRINLNSQASFFFFFLTISSVEITGVQYYDQTWIFLPYSLNNIV